MTRQRFPGIRINIWRGDVRERADEIRKIVPLHTGGAEGAWMQVSTHCRKIVLITFIPIANFKIWSSVAGLWTSEGWGKRLVSMLWTVHSDPWWWRQYAPLKTSVDNHFTRQYIPEDNSEHHTRRRENLKSHERRHVTELMFLSLFNDALSTALYRLCRL
jgi:hypothetical protein